MADIASVLFDTGALIDVYRGRQGLKKRFRAVMAGKMKGYISAVTEAEL